MLMDNREQLVDKHLIIKFIYVSGMKSYLKSYLNIPERICRQQRNGIVRPKLYKPYNKRYQDKAI